MVKQTKVVIDFGSEVAEISAAADKAKTLMRILDDDFCILDTSSPSEAEKTAYAGHCGEIYVLLGFIENCIDRIADSIEPLMLEV